MRVIAGERRGLQLASVKGVETRPTSDKVKESVFNMIGPFFNGGLVVELFGGSGSLSIEAISRGAEQAIIFEKNKDACDVIRKNIEKCQYTDKVRIQRTDARKAVNYLKKMAHKVDFLFIDPPYAEEAYYRLAEAIVADDILSDTAVIICEHDKNIKLCDSYGVFEREKSVTYGNIAISIYRK